MAFTITDNHTAYAALGLADDEVLNRFYRAVPVGPGNGNSVTVNIFTAGTATTPSCSSNLTTGGNNSAVDLTAYDKVMPYCFEFGDLNSLEFSQSSRVALLDRGYRDLSDAVKGVFAGDMVTQFIAGFTNDFTLAATNGNFAGATTALAQDSVAKLGSAVTHVLNESGGRTEDMAIIFPINGTTNNLTAFASQISAHLGNSAAFMSADGYLRFMGVKVYTISNTTNGWGGSSAAASGITQIAAVVLSKLTPGYAMAPVGRNGNVVTGEFADALRINGPVYDSTGDVYRINFSLSFAAGVADETAIAIVSNP